MKTVSLFRFVALAEGISFIVLLGVAMPLKYYYHMPMAVKIFGSAHGFLFISFLLLAFKVMEKENKDFKWLIKAFVLSLLPFGTFVLDKELQKMSR